jgi:hypothetical protein
MNLRIYVAIVAVVCMPLALTACHRSGPQDLLIGKWVAGQGGATLKAEFNQDGTAKLHMLGQTFPGTYQLNGDELAWTTNGMTSKFKVKVTATELDITSGQQTVVYKRE